MTNALYVDVNNFGAKHDGVTDDSYAIQNAIDYASANNIAMVCIPGDYTYAMKAPVVIKTGIHVQLDSVTKLRVTGNFRVFELQKDASISGGAIEIADTSFVSSVLYLHGSQQLEVGNKTSISNMTITNESGAYNGKAIHFYCQNPWDFISFVNIAFLHIRNFNTGIHLKTEKIDNMNTPSWINANNFTHIFMDGCIYGIDIDGNSDLPYEISGNFFFGFQVQCRPQTKRVIRCSGAYNQFDGFIWDTYRMAAQEPAVEFTNITHRNFLYSNLLSSTILDNGQYNYVTSSFEHTRTIHAPGIPGKPNIIGNQDDILVNAHLRYNVKQTSGKAPYGGSLNNCFNLQDELSVNYFDVPDSTPVVIELDFTNNPLSMVNTFGFSCGWKEIPKLVKIEYMQSLNGTWETVKTVQSNLADSVIAEVRADRLYKARITASGFIQSHKRFRINRIFATSSMVQGNAWMATTGGTMYGDMRFVKANGIILEAADGSLWKLSVDSTGAVRSIKL